MYVSPTVQSLKIKIRNIWRNFKFSFYFAHHLSTIEGGMICTSDKKIYEILRMLRSHGMLRESGNKNFEKKTILKHKDLSPKFILCIRV